MVAKIIVGANAGDEGKGLMADYFCHQAALRGEKSIVVLSNGGAQRGHTVVTPDGNRHVFHHFGSGTFSGSDTYLSEKFILNPILFRKEWEELEKIYITPNVYASGNCLVTTPFDMILNQIIEESRGESKHGSCGVGIHETIIRDVCNYPIEMWMDSSDEAKRYYLKEIRSYLEHRLLDVGLKKVPDEWNEIVYSDFMIENFISDLNFIKKNISIRFDDFIGYYDLAVFENGQGLLLDQNNMEYFPHLTPSNTGIKNPLEIISKNGLDTKVEVCYVTRTYLTRHGAGRLDGECDKSEINENIQDMTNVPNPNQGTLRYGKLNEYSLIKRIFKDFEPARKYGANLSLSVTHENEYDFVFSNQFKKNFDFIYFSDGETRKSIVRYGKQ